MRNPSSTRHGHGRLDWRQVGLLYRREMRAALREKSVVLYSILIPIILYPLILWAMFTGLMFVEGKTGDFVSRVAVRAWPPGHLGLRRAFAIHPQIQLVDQPKLRTDAERRLRLGELDVQVEFLPAVGPTASLADNFQVRLTFNESRERSAAARSRITEVIHAYRDQWLKREALARGVSERAWRQFDITTRNVASRRQMGAFLLGLMMPVLFVVMVAVGCFYPAIDATAGERERQTWETLMSTAATRTSIAAAKYFYVASMGGLAGVLNLLAIALTIKPIFAPLMAQGEDAIQFTIPGIAVPVLMLAAILLAGFVAAGMMLFAVFARSFKEGQAMISPFYMLILLPVIFLQVPGLTFTPLWACVPVVNVMLMIRAALASSTPVLPLLVTVVVSLGLIYLSLRFAAFILQFEDVITGSFPGSIKHFVQARVWPRRKTTPPAPEVLS